MLISPGFMLVLLILAMVLGGPPALCLRACAKRRAYVRRRGGSGHWPLAGMALATGTLAFSLALIVPMTTALAGGGAGLGRIHVLSLGLSWICFWVWLFVVVVLRRRRMIY